MYNIGSDFHTACLPILLHFPPLHFWPYLIFHFRIFSHPVHKLSVHNASDLKQYMPHWHTREYTCIPYRWSRIWEGTIFHSGARFTKNPTSYL